jgi:hypothetical protein
MAKNDYYYYTVTVIAKYVIAKKHGEACLTLRV